MPAVRVSKPKSAVCATYDSQPFFQMKPLPCPKLVPMNSPDFALLFCRPLVALLVSDDMPPVQPVHTAPRV